MKPLKSLLGIILILAAAACEGPAGPPGPPGFDGLDGLDGQDGINILGQVLEIEGTFSAENDYSLFFEFPQSVEVFESDVVLVYILFEQVEDPDGGDPIDVWRLLPQTRILDQGLLQYNYDHTFLDVSVFLEADFDLGTLMPGDTDNQIFRITVVPSEFGEDPNVDITDLDSVLANMNMLDSGIQKVELD